MAVIVWCDLRGIARGRPRRCCWRSSEQDEHALISPKGLKTVEPLKGKAIRIAGIGGIGEFAVVESLKRNGLIKTATLAY